MCNKSLDSRRKSNIWHCIKKRKTALKFFTFKLRLGPLLVHLSTRLICQIIPIYMLFEIFAKKKSTLSLQLLRKFKKMSNVWDWWKLPSYNCQRFDFKGIISKPWLGYLKGIIRYFGSKIWKMRIKTNAKWQQFCGIWFLGGWIDPCQMFDFRENCLKTLTLWLGHLKGLVR